MPEQSQSTRDIVNPSQNRTVVMKLTRVKANSKGVVLTSEPYWFWTKFSAQSFRFLVYSACLMEKQRKTWVPIILWVKTKLSQGWEEPGLWLYQFPDLEQTWMVVRAIHSVFVNAIYFYAGCQLNKIKNWFNYVICKLIKWNAYIRNERISCMNCSDDRKISYTYTCN